MIVSAISIPLV